MLTELEKKRLCEVLYGAMEEREVYDIMIEHLLEWLKDFDEEELDKMYAFQLRITNE